MPIAEISGYKLIVRMTDADSLGGDAKRFMNGRLTHHVHILEMNGESFRLKHSRQSGKA